MGRIVTSGEGELRLTPTSGLDETGESVNDWMQAATAELHLSPRLIAYQLVRGRDHEWSAR